MIAPEIKDIKVRPTLSTEILNVPKNKMYKKTWFVGFHPFDHTVESSLAMILMVSKNPF